MTERCYDDEEAAEHIHVLGLPDGNGELEMVTLMQGENWLRWSQAEGNDGTVHVQASIVSLDADNKAAGVVPSHKEINSISSDCGEWCYLCFDVDGSIATVKDMRDPLHGGDDVHRSVDAWTVVIQKESSSEDGANAPNNAVHHISRRRMHVVRDHDVFHFYGLNGESPKLSLFYRYDYGTIVDETTPSSPAKEAAATSSSPLQSSPGQVADEAKHASPVQEDPNADYYDDEQHNFPIDAKEATPSKSDNSSENHDDLPEKVAPKAMKHNKEPQSPVSAASESSTADPTSTRVQSHDNDNAPKRSPSSPSTPSTAASAVETQIQIKAVLPVSIENAAKKEEPPSQLSSQSDAEEEEGDASSDSDTASESGLNKTANSMLEGGLLLLLTQPNSTNDDDNASFVNAHDDEDDDDSTVDPLQDASDLHLVKQTIAAPKEIFVFETIAVTATAAPPQNADNAQVVSDCNPGPEKSHAAPIAINYYDGGEEETKLSDNILPLAEEKEEQQPTTPPAKPPAPRNSARSRLQSPEGLCSPDLLGSSPDSSHDPLTPADDSSSPPQKPESSASNNNAPNLSIEAREALATELLCEAEATTRTTQSKAKVDDESEKNQNGDESPTASVGSTVERETALRSDDATTMQEETAANCETALTRDSSVRAVATGGETAPTALAVLEEDAASAPTDRNAAPSMASTRKSSRKQRATLKKDDEVTAAMEAVFIAPVATDVAKETVVREDTRQDSCSAALEEDSTNAGKVMAAEQTSTLSRKSSRKCKAVLNFEVGATAAFDQNITTMDGEASVSMDDTKETLAPEDTQHVSKAISSHTDAPGGDPAAETAPDLKQTRASKAKPSRKGKNMPKLDETSTKANDGVDATRSVPLAGDKSEQNVVPPDTESTHAGSSGGKQAELGSKPTHTLKAKSSRKRKVTKRDGAVLDAEDVPLTGETSEDTAAPNADKTVSAAHVDREVQKDLEQTHTSKKRTTVSNIDGNTSPSGRKPTTEDDGARNAPVKGTPQCARPNRATRSARKRTTPQAEADSTKDAQPSAAKRSRRTPQAAASDRRSMSPSEGTKLEEARAIRILATGFDLDTKQKKASQTFLFQGSNVDCLLTHALVLYFSAGANHRRSFD